MTNDFKPLLKLLYFTLENINSLQLTFHLPITAYIGSKAVFVFVILEARDTENRDLTKSTKHNKDFVLFHCHANFFGLVFVQNQYKFFSFYITVTHHLELLSALKSVEIHSCPVGNEWWQTGRNWDYILGEDAEFFNYLAQHYVGKI